MTSSQNWAIIFWKIFFIQIRRFQYDPDASFETIFKQRVLCNVRKKTANVTHEDECTQWMSGENCE